MQHTIVRCCMLYTTIQGHDAKYGHNKKSTFFLIAQILIFSSLLARVKITAWDSNHPPLATRTMWLNHRAGRDDIHIANLYEFYILLQGKKKKLQCFQTRKMYYSAATLQFYRNASSVYFIRLPWYTTCCTQYYFKTHQRANAKVLWVQWLFPPLLRVLVRVWDMQWT